MISFQQIAGYIGQIPQYYHQKVDPIKAALADRVAELWTRAVNSFPILKPFHKRYIKPLEPSDRSLFSNCAIAAIIVIMVAYQIFGKSMIAASTMLGFGILLASWKFSRYRIEKRHNREASAIFAAMHGVVTRATPANLLLNEIEAERVKLNRTKYEHLKDERENLDRHIQEFRRDAIDPARNAQFNGFQQTLLTHLDDVREKLAK